MRYYLVDFQQSIKSQQCEQFVVAVATRQYITRQLQRQNTDHVHHKPQASYVMLHQVRPTSRHSCNRIHIVRENVRNTAKKRKNHDFLDFETRKPS